METYIVAAAAAAGLICLAHALWIHKKMNNFMRDIAEELSDTFLDYIRVSERLDELEDSLKKDEKIIKPKPGEVPKDVWTKKLFVKKSLFNLDIPRNKNISPEALEDLFNEAVIKRWWKNFPPENPGK